jgi:18S rRNA (guanine1575-N7)-methyltransferase
MKKYYLFLQAGYTKESIDEVMKNIPKIDLDDEKEDVVDNIQQRRKRKREKYHESVYKSRNWILKKKERERNKGRDVRPDTRYTGRKRKLKSI